MSGPPAILGMDLVAFSELDEREQLQAVGKLFAWIKAGLQFYAIADANYRWSPGGDGGHLTFTEVTGSERALDVAFKILEQAREWSENHRPAIRIRFGIHAGTVQEGHELGSGTNVWGHGINTAARITSIASPFQVLISDEYYNDYVKNRGIASAYVFGEPFERTVKHGKPIKVRNVQRHNLGLPDDRALALRWEGVGELWKKARRDYEFLIRDALESDDVVAALAAGKCLLGLGGDLGGGSAVDHLFAAISNADQEADSPYKRRQHVYFSKMPAAALRQLLQRATFCTLPTGEVLFHEGDSSDKVYFPISGQVEVAWKDPPGAALVKRGEILGETALWISEIRRTGTVKAVVDTLLLEVRYADFQAVIEQHPHLAEEIAGTIKQRTLKNAVDRPDFFPGISNEQKEALRQRPAECVKVPAGWPLDLRKTTWFLFNGKVRISPTNAASFELSANGHFTARNIFGLVTGLGVIDGDEAAVLEEAVCVDFPHDVLRLQEESEAVQSRWWELFGRRNVEIRMRQKDSRTQTG
jgi:class 3 adenylate cyclase